jgi:hypothetical protein
MECAAFEHGGHQKAKIADLVVASREAILDGASRASAFEKKLVQARAGLQTRRGEVQTAADDEKRAVKLLVRRLRQAVTAAGEVADAKVDAKANRKLAVLAAHIVEVNGAAENLADGAALANSTVVLARPAELLQRRPLLVSGLEALCNHGVCLEPKCGTYVGFGSCSDAS